MFSKNNHLCIQTIQTKRIDWWSCHAKKYAVAPPVKFFLKKRKKKPHLEALQKKDNDDINKVKSRPDIDDPEEKPDHSDGDNSDGDSDVENKYPRNGDSGSSCTGCGSVFTGCGSGCTGNGQPKTLLTDKDSHFLENNRKNNDKDSNLKKNNTKNSHNNGHFIDKSCNKINMNKNTEIFLFVFNCVSYKSIFFYFFTLNIFF